MKHNIFMLIESINVIAARQCIEEQESVFDSDTLPWCSFSSSGSDDCSSITAWKK